MNTYIVYKCENNIKKVVWVGEAEDIADVEKEVGYAGFSAYEWLGQKFQVVEADDLKFADAIKKYLQGLKFHYHWHGKRVLNMVGNERTTRQKREEKYRAENCLSRLEEEIIESGISFKRVWTEVNGVDPDNIPALKGHWI
ncbi:MAG: hypothetical protein U9O55_03570 [Patescibacteria group bacterium]|nr:hypothetical protein [Patescibacteria group bacterium]